MNDALAVIGFLLLLAFMVVYPFYYRGTRGEVPVYQGRMWGALVAAGLVVFPALHKPSVLGAVSVVAGLGIFFFIFRLNRETTGSIGQALALTAWHTLTSITIIVTILVVLMEISDMVNDKDKKPRN